MVGELVVSDRTVLMMLEGVQLRVVAELIGARVTSWVRGVEDNARVGGHVASYHLIGGAIDVGAETADWQRQVLRRFAREVDEVASKAHWHYQVDGRGAVALAALVVLGAQWWQVVRQKGVR